MLDFSHIPQGADVQRFIGPRGVDSSFVWQRPRGATMAHIFCVSFGGNGGAGFASASGGSAGGGGGGGSSSQSTLVIPLLLLPERLHIHHSSAVGVSWVGLDPAPTVQANSMLIRATRGPDGTTATSATGAAGGSAGAIATIAQMPLAGLGFFQLLAGQAGTSGGNTGTGTNTSVATTGLTVMGGAGGGGHGTGSGGAGGTIPAAGIYPLVNGGAGTGTTTTPGGDGQHGFNLGGSVVEFFSAGTGGGACHASATGAGLFAGNGGNGSFGSGGGGGGGYITGATGGQGGLGGPGLIVITSW